MLQPGRSSTENGVAPTLMASAALAAERNISWVRLTFCVAALVRFFWVTESFESPRLALTLLPTASVLAFSVWILWRRQGDQATLPRWVLDASAVLDMAACVIVLLPMALWPANNSPSLLRKPDLAALLLVLTASGLRLQVTATLWSGATALAGFGALMVLDRHAGPDPIRGLAISMWTVILLAGTATAGIMAARTRRLVKATERQSAELLERRNRLIGILSDHHDVRNLLSSATVQAGLALQALESGAAPRSRQLLSSATRELEAVNELSRAVREIGRTELLQDVRPVPVALDPVFKEVFRRTQIRWPKLNLHVPAAPNAAVYFSGGAKELARILGRLVDNGAEGDRGRAADHIWIRIFDEGSTVRIRIEDDGPGFEADRLGGPVVPTESTKPEGSGLGLFLVQLALQVQGGSCRLSNRDEGGAVVELTLRAAPSDSGPLGPDLHP